MPIIYENNKRYLLGKYRGEVKSNEDPEGLGRLKVIVPSIWNSQIHHAWAEPNFPSPEFFYVPPVGSIVWIEFEEGDPDLPIWTGCVLKNDEPHFEAKSVSPRARSIKTEEGLRVTLDDSVKEITIQAKDNTKIVLKLDDEKVIIDAESIELGEGASEALVLGDAFQSLFNSHTHSGVDPGGGTSGPPSQSMTSSHLSSKHKVEA